MTRLLFLLAAPIAYPAVTAAIALPLYLSQPRRRFRSFGDMWLEVVLSPVLVPVILLALRRTWPIPEVHARFGKDSVR